MALSLSYQLQMEQAVAEDDADLISHFIEIGYDIHAKLQDGTSLLHHAALHNSCKAAECLLAAMQHEASEGFDILKELNRPAESYGDYTPMHFACAANHCEFVDLLVQFNATVDVMDSIGRSPLQLAICHNALQTVDILLAAGADPNWMDERGLTPLLDASKANIAGVVRPLFEAGADLDAKSAEQSTALHFCAWQGHSNIAKILIELGANIEARRNGQTPLHLASKYGHLDVVRLLLDNSADPHSIDRSSRLPEQCIKASVSEKVKKKIKRILAQARAEDLSSRRRNHSRSEGSLITYLTPPSKKKGKVTSNTSLLLSKGNKNSRASERRFRKDLRFTRSTPAAIQTHCSAESTSRDGSFCSYPSTPKNHFDCDAERQQARSQRAKLLALSPRHQQLLTKSKLFTTEPSRASESGDEESVSVLTFTGNGGLDQSGQDTIQAVDEKRYCDSQHSKEEASASQQLKNATVQAHSLIATLDARLKEFNLLKLDKEEELVASGAAQKAELEKELEDKKTAFVQAQSLIATLEARLQAVQAQLEVQAVEKESIRQQEDALRKEFNLFKAEKEEELALAIAQKAELDKALQERETAAEQALSLTSILEARLQATQAQLEVQTEEQDSIGKQQDALRKEFDLFKAEKGEELASSSAQKAELEKTLKEKETAVVQAQSSIATLEARLQATQAQLEVQREERESIGQQEDSLRKAFDLFKAEKGEELASTIAQNAELDKALQERETAAIQTQSLVETLQARLQATQAQLEVQVGETESIGQQKDALRDALELLEANKEKEVASVIAQRAELEKALEDKETMAEQAQSLIATLEARLQATQAQLEVQTEERRSIGQKQDALRKEFGLFKAEKGEQLASVVAQKAELDKELQKRETAAMQAQSLVETLQARLQATQAQLEVQAGETERIGQQKDALRDALDLLKMNKEKELASVIAQRAELEKVLEEKETLAEQAQSMIATLEARLQATQAQLEVQSREMESIGQQQDALRKEFGLFMTEKEEQLASVIAQKAELDKALQERETAAKQAQSLIATLEAHLQTSQAQLEVQAKEKDRIGQQRDDIRKVLGLLEIKKEKELASVIAQRTELEKSLEDKEIAAKNAQSLIETLEEQLYATQTKQEELQCSLKRKEAEYQGLAVEFESLKNRLEESSAMQQERLQGLQTKIAEEVKKNGSLSKNLAVVEKEYHDHMLNAANDIEFLQQQLLEHTLQIQELITQIELQNAQKKLFQSSTESLQQRLEKRIDELQKALEGEMNGEESSKLGRLLNLERELNRNLQNEIQDVNKRLGKRISELQENLTEMKRNKDSVKIQAEMNLALLNSTKQKCNILKKKLKTVQEEAGVLCYPDPDTEEGSPVKSFCATENYVPTGEPWWKYSAPSPVYFPKKLSGTPKKDNLPHNSDEQANEPDEGEEEGQHLPQLKGIVQEAPERIPVHDLDQNSIEQLLDKVSLGKYKATFKEHGVDGAALCQLQTSKKYMVEMEEEDKLNLLRWIQRAESQGGVLLHELTNDHDDNDGDENNHLSNCNFM